MILLLFRNFFVVRFSNSICISEIHFNRFRASSQKNDKPSCCSCSSNNSSISEAWRFESSSSVDSFRKVRTSERNMPDVCARSMCSFFFFWVNPKNRQKTGLRPIGLIGTSRIVFCCIGSKVKKSSLGLLLKPLSRILQSSFVIWLRSSQTIKMKRTQEFQVKHTEWILAYAPAFALVEEKESVRDILVSAVDSIDPAIQEMNPK